MVPSILGTLEFSISLKKNCWGCSKHNLMKQFMLNKFNFVTCGLKQIDQTKRRGVIALDPIKAGDIICLFPGKPTFRIPKDASETLPISNFPNPP